MVLTSVRPRSAQLGCVLRSRAGEKPEIHFKRQMEVAIGPSFRIRDEEPLCSQRAWEFNAHRRNVSPISPLLVQMTRDNEVSHRAACNWSGLRLGLALIVSPAGRLLRLDHVQ